MTGPVSPRKVAGRHLRIASGAWISRGGNVRRTSYNIFEGPDRTILLVHVIEARYLDQPADVVRVELVVDYPLRKLVPFVEFPAIDADPPFTILRNVFE